MHTRACSNPTPAHGGKPCSGNATEQCDTEPCAGMTRHVGMSVFSVGFCAYLYPSVYVCVKVTAHTLPSDQVTTCALNLVVPIVTMCALLVLCPAYYFRLCCRIPSRGIRSDNAHPSLGFRGRLDISPRSCYVYRFTLEEAQGCAAHTPR